MEEGSSSSSTTTCTDTCASLIKQCGTQTICGVSTNCGTCSTGYVCNLGLCIEESTCTDTCSSLGHTCGSVCGVNCGTCSTGYSCEGNGTCIKNCVPTTCIALGRTCGSVSDGCGGTLNCGSCSTGYSCAGNGTCIKDDGTLKYIVENGIGYSDIIVSSSASNEVKLAATYFQMYIYNMTGVRLPISNTINQSKLYHVYIGQSSYTDNLGITSAGCENGGFKIISGTNYLALIGDDEPFVLSGPDNYAEWDSLTGDTWENDFIDFYGWNYNSA